MVAGVHLVQIDRKVDVILHAMFICNVILKTPLQKTRISHHFGEDKKTYIIVFLVKFITWQAANKAGGLSIFICLELDIK